MFIVKAMFNVAKLKVLREILRDFYLWTKRVSVEHIRELTRFALVVLAIILALKILFS